MVQSSQTFAIQDASGGRGSHAKQDAKLRDPTTDFDIYCQNAATSFDGKQHWMAVTIIEDDDLMFGGKPLCTWYEEDRRCSMAEDNASSPCSFTDDDEELRRGRQRDRPQYHQTAHKHHKKSYGSESEEEKKHH